MDCLFCKITSGEIPSKTIYENEHVKAIMDINPTSNGHILIIPKKHVTDFTEMVAAVLPIGLAVFTATFAVKKGMKFFKNM